LIVWFYEFDESMGSSNPLIQKWEEIHKKKEPPKMPRIEDYEGEETIADELKKSKSKLKTYDLDDLKTSFRQVAEQVKNGEVQVYSMSVERGRMRGTIITFEVYDYGL
jgi:uncharacterized protein YabN with tetrapyrrole methylase and pyrophosphatase domain